MASSRPRETRHHTASPGFSRTMLRPALPRPPAHSSWLRKCLEGAKTLPPEKDSEPFRRNTHQEWTSEIPRPLSRTVHPISKPEPVPPNYKPSRAIPITISPEVAEKTEKQGLTETMGLRPNTQNTRSSTGSLTVVDMKATMEEYVMGKELGQGAYATVRAATHIATNRLVAIKTYEKFKLLDPQRKKSVQREIRILSKLDHPSIVKLLEAIDCTRQLHLVLEFVPGISLNAYLKQKSDRRLEEYDAKRIFRQLLSGVEYCHTRNVSHRDLKLENVLLDERNNVKIIDFGFATCFARDKKVKMFCGTPSYMAPEIVARKEYCGPPADVWALGVILYTMLCGTLPFKGQNDKELYQRIVRGQYALPQCVPGLARPLVASMLSVDPSKRPSISQLISESWVGLPDKKAIFSNTTIRPGSFLGMGETGVLRAVMPKSLGTSGSQRRLRIKEGSPTRSGESPGKVRWAGKISE